MDPEALRLMMRENEPTLQSEPGHSTVAPSGVYERAQNQEGSFNVGSSEEGSSKKELLNACTRMAEGSISGK